MNGGTAALDNPSPKVVPIYIRRSALMAGSQFHNVSDVCTAMKQFSTSTSQSAAKGSFTTLDSLTTFSEAITCLCDEVMQLRAEIDELKTAQKSAGGAVPPPKSARRHKAKRKMPTASRRAR